MMFSLSPASPWEGGPLPLEVLSQRLLYLGEQIGETFHLALSVGQVHDVHHQRRLGHLLHQTKELCAHAGEGQQ